MTGFSADWLDLRRTADDRARDPGLMARLSDHFAGRGQARVLDLGSGAGANLFVTHRLLPGSQHWVLTDNDPALLALAVAEPFPNIEVECRTADLAADLAALFDPEPDLVTCSAFLDLCGAAWLDHLAALAARHRAAVYAVLSYDGRESWAPPHPLDAAALAAFHADQRRDKGLGPSLGPDAHAHLASALRGHGYVVLEARSDWRLEQPRDAGMIDALARGSAAAVAGALGTGAASQWRAAREAAQQVTIGHRDLLALPPG